jgi:oligopeptide transport system ATP-binding protein
VTTPSAVALVASGISTSFRTHDGIVRAVEDVSLDVQASRTLGVVGESGCGKSITAMSIMRLIRPPGRIDRGRVLLGETDLLTLSESEMRAIRGNRISMIFQEPMTSLNPVLTTGWQVVEAIRLHRNVTQQEATELAVEMFREVGIPDPSRRIRQYPHEMSGGMRQRVMIAMALATRPEVLIADEPTTALDVTIQAQILDLMRRLQADLGMSLMLITHDLGVVAEMADTVAVMYAGRVVETGTVIDIFDRPQHPYTQGLLTSLPRLTDSRRRLPVVEGAVPDPLDRSQGCRFAPRCPSVMQVCTSEEPPLGDVGPGHAVRCWLALTGAAAGAAVVNGDAAAGGTDADGAAPDDGVRRADSASSKGEPA